MPLWLRWLLTVAGFGAAAVVLIIVVGGSGNSSDGNAAALLRAGERVRRGVLHDQAPHSSKLHAGVPPAVGLERAIAADVRGRVRRHELAGPTRGVSCMAVDPGKEAGAPTDARHGPAPSDIHSSPSPTCGPGASPGAGSIRFPRRRGRCRSAPGASA